MVKYLHTKISVEDTGRRFDEKYFITTFTTSIPD